jgi:hypothetical protein
MATIPINLYFGTTGLHLQMSRPHYEASIPAGTYLLEIIRSSTNIIMDVNNCISVVMQEVPL